MDLAHRILLDKLLNTVRCLLSDTLDAGIRATSNAAKIEVIGAGVSGLTTAITLQLAGYSVSIYAEKLPNETTSAVAAAIWFPYKVGPKKKSLQWSQITYEWFQYLAAKCASSSGVSMVNLLELVDNEADAWWLSAIPKTAARLARPDEMPKGFDLGYLVRVPMIQTQIYLPFLERIFRNLGGKIQQGRMENMTSFVDDANLMVNCSGLGARELVRDTTMYAIKGQLLKLEPMEDCAYVVADAMPGMHLHEATYVFPRKDCIVLGGTAIQGEDSIDWDRELGERLLVRCISLVPKLAGLKIQSQVIGLRPGRPEIRLERNGRLIHNYGHGGSGFTVSWGCALEVLKLVSEDEK